MDHHQQERRQRQADHVQHRPEVRLDVAPGPLEPALRVDLLDEQQVVHLGRLTADCRVERVGERVRRIGGKH